MKKQVFIIIFICFCYPFYEQKVLAETWYYVRWVDDGDTIVLQDGRHVRYIGINAPEIEHEDQKAEPFGNKAKSLNKRLVYQKKVRLEFDQDKQDQYGRWLAYVFLKDGTFINARILAQGYAFYLYRRPNLTYNSILFNSQRKAMSGKKGMWQKWREQNAIYSGNKHSRRFHLPACPFAKKIKSSNRIIFSKKWDAFWAGYAPAKKCVEEYWSYE